MAILKFRDENGSVQEILALRGPRGERGIDAYAKAVEYGYEGTEEEFYIAMGRNGHMVETETYEVMVISSWTESGDYFYQDISVPGMRETDNPIPGVAYGEDNDANVLYDDCFGSVLHITTYDDKVRVWAKKAIKTTFPLQLKVVR